MVKKYWKYVLFYVIITYLIKYFVEDKIAALSIVLFGSLGYLIFQLEKDIVCIKGKLDRFKYFINNDHYMKKSGIEIDNDFNIDRKIIPSFADINCLIEVNFEKIAKNLYENVDDIKCSCNKEDFVKYMYTAMFNKKNIYFKIFWDLRTNRFFYWFPSSKEFGSSFEYQSFSFCDHEINNCGLSKSVLNDLEIRMFSTEGSICLSRTWSKNIAEFGKFPVDLIFKNILNNIEKEEIFSIYKKFHFDDKCKSFLENENFSYKFKQDEYSRDHIFSGEYFNINIKIDNIYS